MLAGGNEQVRVSEEVQLDVGLEVKITFFFVSVKHSPLCILI